MARGRGVIGPERRGRWGAPGAAPAAQWPATTAKSMGSPSVTAHCARAVNEFGHNTATGMRTDGQWWKRK
jgi:hypothetical protein